MKIFMFILQVLFAIAMGFFYGEALAQWAKNRKQGFDEENYTKGMRFYLIGAAFFALSTLCGWIYIAL